jgi:hypothetical protein
MRDLELLSRDDCMWDPDILQKLPNRVLAKKMEQTYLSRIGKHRALAGSVSEKLGLGQQIGILLWLNRVDLLSTKGEERLLFLQSKAPWSSLEKGMKFAQRLEGDFKLQLDFYHFMVVLNCHPSTQRLRKWREANRIGVGYRDKGTLPSPSARSVRKATEEAWVPIDQLGEKLQAVLNSAPDLVEGEWVDLPGLAQLLAGLASGEVHSLLDP